MKFTLEIELGNDAMQTYGDLALAVQNVSHRIVNPPDSPNTLLSAHDDLGRVFNRNGNMVGKWEVTE